MAGYATRSGGIIIWVAPQKEAGPIMPLVKEMASSETATDFHRRLIAGNIPDQLTSFGISYIMQVVFFKGARGKIPCDSCHRRLDRGNRQDDEVHSRAHPSGSR